MAKDVFYVNLPDMKFKVLRGGQRLIIEYQYYGSCLLRGVDGSFGTPRDAVQACILCWKTRCPSLARIAGYY